MKITFLGTGTSAIKLLEFGNATATVYTKGIGFDVATV